MQFGAQPADTTVNNAEAINKAISFCAQKGGGTVSVPGGTFTTGTIYLKSGVMLQLEPGAVLRGSTRIADYAPLSTKADLSKYESGQGTVNYNSATDPIWSQALVMAVGISRAGICGEGIIDGADVRNPKGEEHMRGPHTVLMADCKDMTFKDFSVRRSANYAFLGYKLSKSEFKHITVEGGWDGIHVRGANDVEIEDCRFFTGDDAVAGGYWDNMRIEGCTMNSSCNGIRMIMPSTNVLVKDCYFFGAGRYEHITSHRTNSENGIIIEPGAWGKAPGRLDNIRISHCYMREVLAPVCVTLGEDNSLGTITIDNLTARDITRMALSVKSWGTAKTDRVVMKDCDMEFRGIDDPSLPEWFKDLPTNQWPFFPCWGAYFRNVGSVKADNVKLSFKGNDYRRATMMDNVGSTEGTFSAPKQP